MRRARILLAALLPLLSTSLAAGQLPRIAIIIDDLGYQLMVGQRVIALPGPVACAILPGAPRARQLAHAANDNGKEVLLHLPMQAVETAGPVEETRMTLDMSRGNFAATFEAAFVSVPHAIGISSILQRGVAGSGFLRSLWQPSDGYRTGGLGGDVGSGVADHRKQLVQHRVHLRDRIDQQLALSPKG